MVLKLFVEGPSRVLPLICDIMAIVKLRGPCEWACWQMSMLEACNSTFARYCCYGARLAGKHASARLGMKHWNLFVLAISFGHLIGFELVPRHVFSWRPKAAARGARTVRVGSKELTEHRKRRQKIAVAGTESLRETGAENQFRLSR